MIIKMQNNEENDQREIQSRQKNAYSPKKKMRWHNGKINNWRKNQERQTDTLFPPFKHPHTKKKEREWLCVSC